MAVEDYDPVKRKERYERTKKLKGRQKGTKAEDGSTVRPGFYDTGTKGTSSRPNTTASHDRVIRVRQKVKKLQTALSETQQELSSRRQTAREEKKKNSDGKSTAEEKQASQQYRDKHKTELASKSKSKSSTGGGSTSSSSVADMSTRDLEARVIKIKSAIRDARRLLSSASIEHGQLMHSALVSDPDVNERFARYTSAERGPST